MKLCSCPIAGVRAKRRAATGGTAVDCTRVRAAAAAVPLLPLLAAEECPEEVRCWGGEGSTLRILAASYTTGAKGEAACMKEGE